MPLLNVLNQPSWLSEKSELAESLAESKKAMEAIDAELVAADAEIAAIVAAPRSATSSDLTRLSSLRKKRVAATQQLLAFVERMRDSDLPGQLLAAAQGECDRAQRAFESQIREVCEALSSLGFNIDGGEFRGQPAQGRINIRVGLTTGAVMQQECDLHRIRMIEAKQLVSDGTIRDEASRELQAEIRRLLAELSAAVRSFAE